MKNSIISLFAGAILLAFAAQVNADSITSWDFTVDAKFTEWSKDGETFYTSENQPASNSKEGNFTVHSEDDGKTLRWGARKNSGTTSKPNWGWSDKKGATSSLELKTVDSGKIKSSEREDGEWISRDDQKAVTITHNNKVIASGSSPQYISMKLSINLAAVNAEFEKTINMQINFAFYETPNTGSNQNDIFWVLDGWDTVSETFEYNGEYYDISIGSSFISNDNLITGTYANMIQERTGLDGTVYGWTTQEGKSTSFDLFFTVRHPGDGQPEIITVSEQMTASVSEDSSATPEPATMLIMGLGLAGAGFAARRRMRG